MKNKRYLALILVILGALILSCGSKKDKTEQGQRQKQKKKGRQNIALS